MKIAHVCPRYDPYIGGVETHVKEISERLVKLGYEVDVLSTDPSGKLLKKEKLNGVTVRRFKSIAPSESYFLSLELKRFLENNSFDIVHAHGYHAFPSLFAAYAKTTNKLVFTPHYHGSGHTFFRDLLHKPYKFIARASFKKAASVICVSEYERKLLMRDFNVDGVKVLKIPNGVNSHEFSNLKRNMHDHFNILYVGRLEQYKGVQYLIEALPKLGSNFKLDIVGKGPYKSSLFSLVKQRNLVNSVFFYDELSRKDLIQKYADADLFVLLSNHEAFGITVAEALSAGVPCLVAFSSGLKEWVNNINCFGISYPIALDMLVRKIKSYVGISINKPDLLSWDAVTYKISNVYQDLRDASPN